MREKIRIISGERIADAVAGLYAEACTVPEPQVAWLLQEALKDEPSGPGREALELELENLRVAERTGLPICQDTGTAVVFVELGSSVCVPDGTLGKWVDEGVRRACQTSFLRPSQVFPPLSSRSNTGDNAPAVLHLEHVSGPSLKISVLAKGAGCENVSRSAMLLPGHGTQGVKSLALQCVLQGASKACPPVFLGIGIGGTLEVSGILAKKALLRPAGSTNPDGELAILEREITEEVNRSGIGPQGFGGRITALETRILQTPCHMASLPVTVCVECHVHRTASCVL